MPEYNGRNLGYQRVAYPARGEHRLLALHEHLEGLLARQQLKRHHTQRPCVQRPLRQNILLPWSPRVFWPHACLQPMHLQLFVAIMASQALLSSWMRYNICVHSSKRFRFLARRAWLERRSHWSVILSL